MPKLYLSLHYDVGMNANQTTLEVPIEDPLLQRNLETYLNNTFRTIREEVERRTLVPMAPPHRGEYAASGGEDDRKPLPWEETERIYMK